MSMVSDIIDNLDEIRRKLNEVESDVKNLNDSLKQTKEIADDWGVSILEIGDYYKDKIKPLIDKALHKNDNVAFCNQQ